MLIDDEPIKKIYYSVPEVGIMLNMTDSHIRYYCKEAAIRPKRNRKNYRLFSEEELAYLKEIRELVLKGLTLKGAIKYIKNGRML